MIRTPFLFALSIGVVALSACGSPANTTTRTSDVDQHTASGGESHQVTRENSQTDQNGNSTRHVETTEQTTPPPSH